MDPLNNNNTIEADHAASPPEHKITQNLNQTTAHPLQDISLTMHENMLEMQSEQQQQRAQSKENWVKFDDDVNESSGNNVENFLKNKNNINNEQSSYDQADSSIATSAAIPASKLLSKSTSPTALLPPPPQMPSRPRTPIESAKKLASQSTLQREPVTITPLNDSPTPAQRSFVSSGTTTATTSATVPDVAPAVLTTESTHVNLNASGKAQHQQQQSSLPQQQHNKTKKTSYTGSNVNNSNQQHHQQQQQPLQAHHTQLPSTQHHTNNNINNGTTTSMPTATTNNAMHHKSHHNQHQHQHHQTNAIAATTAPLPVEASTSSTGTSGPQAMRTIELSTGRIREGFANGDVIVTLLPANTKWPWITPAIFRPELVPEELMAQGLTLTVEEYVQAMETLVNDYRFTVYNICYKRILVCWILFAFTVLLALLFSGLQGVALFSLGVGWLFLNAAAIFLCMWVKLRLARGLEKCLARVNRQLMKHKILLILDDRGRISCHKVNLCFLYFDSTQCVNFLNEFLEQTERNGGEEVKAGWESKLDIDLNDIVIQGTTPVRLSRKQAVAQELYLSYLQRWGKDFLRRRLDWTIQEAGVHETPRHLQSSICPCQYEEEILRNKIKMHLRRRQCCGIDCLGCWL